MSKQTISRIQEMDLYDEYMKSGVEVLENIGRLLEKFDLELVPFKEILPGSIVLKVDVSRNPNDIVKKLSLKTGTNAWLSQFYINIVVTREVTVITVDPDCNEIYIADQSYILNPINEILSKVNVGGMYDHLFNSFNSTYDMYYKWKILNT